MKYALSFIMAVGVAVFFVHRARTSHMKQELMLRLQFEQIYEQGYWDGKKEGFKAGLKTCDDVLAKSDTDARY